jgi:hypothetical protein
MLHYLVSFVCGLGIAYLIYVRFLMVPFYHWLMVKIHQTVSEVKKDLFKEAIKSIESLAGDQKPNVLEVGVGAGENFRHFPLGSSVTLLDKTEQFMPFLTGNWNNSRIVSFAKLTWSILGFLRVFQGKA